MSLVQRALFVLLCAMLAVPAAAKGPTVVRIGTSGNYPPFTFIDENNRFQGFEIDIANALCAKMDVKCEFVKQEWSDMIPALLANRFDAIFGSMVGTEERRKKIDFTNHYYRSPAIFAARKAANLRETSPAAMKGRVVGAQLGSIHENYLQRVYAPAGVVVKIFKTYQEAQFELARGRVDAIFAGKFAIYQWIEKTEQGKCCAFAGSDISDETYLGQGVAIGVRKENADLKERFNQAIDALVASGAYKKINDKYFPFGIY
jgi:polar amino acid transport system substrate-binding protein